MRGFTIIELLVVLGISALFSALAITYSSVGRNAISLSVENSEISQFILQAKSLSLTTYTSPFAGTSCGYGIVFNLTATPQTYSIFAYSPSGAPTCPAVSSITGISQDEEKEYTDGTWNVPVTNGVKITSENYSDGLETVLFYPPDPTVFLSTDGATFQLGTAKVYLETADGKNSAVISVNPEGQVSF